MKGKLFRSALLASAAVLISTGGGLVLSSCIEVGTSETKSSGKVEKIELYAAVQGVVKDDTGKPVVGAKVTIGNLTTTTNEAGYYYFEKVPVTAVYGREADTPTYHDIVITIKAPEGSNLVETIMVTAKPVAQQFDSVHNNETGTAVSNPNTTFTQLLAQAKTAVMAHKAASIHGVLRMEGTGEPIANAIVKISAGKTPGCEYPECQYQVDPIVVTTGEDGSFSANGLLNGTEYDIEVAGYNVSYTFTTPDYQGEGHNYALALGNIYATPIIAADTIPPKIVVNPARYGGKIIGIMGTDLVQLSTPSGDFTGLLVLAPGVDGANQPIPVMFSEKMNTAHPLTPNQSVVVYDETAKQIVNVTNLAWDADGKTLLITTEEPIPEGHDIYVRLRGYEFQDLAGNPLQVKPGNPPTNVISTASVSDPLVEGPLGNKEDYVQIQYEIYDPTTAVVDPVEDLVQLDVPEADDNTADDDPTPFYSVDTTFENHKGFYDVDEDDTNATIAQLNDPSITASTDDKICELANALNSNINATNCIVNNATKLAFTPVDGVNNYRIKKNGTSITDIDITTLTDTFTTVVPGLEARINDGKVELRMSNVAVGDQIDVVSLNGFGDEATAASVILEDTVPMFVTTQSRPVNGTGPADIITGGPSAGSGGYLVDLGGAGGGTGLPFFNARADMYAPSAGSVNWNRLKGPDNYYTSAEWENYPLSRTLGLWISEPTQEEDLTGIMQALSEGSPVAGAISSAIYAGYFAGYPLIAFTVPNILNVQHWDRLSLAGAHDQQGNVSGSEAQALIADKMPPVVTNAYIEGTDLVIELSENVSLTDADGNLPNPYNAITLNNSKTGTNWTLQINPTTGSVTGVVTGYSYTDQYGNNLASPQFDVTVTGNQVRIRVSDPAGNVDVSKYWEGLVYGDDNGAGQYTLGTDYATAINSLIPDESGNEWANNGDTIGAPPAFVVEDREAPRVDAGSDPINDAANPLMLNITDQNGNTHNQDAGSGGVGGAANDGNWYVGDNTAGEKITVKITFREPILWDVDNDGDVDVDDLAALGYSIEVVPDDATLTTYTRIATAYGTVVTRNAEIEIDPAQPNVLNVNFTLQSGTVQAGDKLIIRGIKDSAGNEVGTITITLNAAGEGISISPNAY